jgi:hypothetical protein
MAQSRSRDASPSDDAHADDDVAEKMGDDYNFESTSSSSSFSPLLNVDDAFLDDEHKKLFSKSCDILPPTGSENGAASSSLDYYEFDDTDARERIANREPPSENDDDDMTRMLFYVCLVESLKNFLMTFIDLFPRMPFVLVLVSPFPRAPSERTRKWRVVWKSPAFCLLETELRERRQRMEQPPPSPPQADSSSPPRPALTLDEMTFLCREFGLIPPPSDEEEEEEEEEDHNGGFIASAV